MFWVSSYRECGTRLPCIAESANASRCILRFANASTGILHFEKGYVPLRSVLGPWGEKVDHGHLYLPLLQALGLSIIAYKLSLCSGKRFKGFTDICLHHDGHDMLYM